MRRWMCMVPLAALLAGCGGGGDDAPRPPDAEPVTPAPADTGGSAAAPGPATDSAETGLAVVVNRRGDGAYALWGRTDAQALELTVEDGHNVLYGPAQVEVRDGAFSTELTLEPTDRPTVFAYVTEPGGARQWVVPIPRDGSRVVWGAGAADLPEPAPAPAP